MGCAQSVDDETLKSRNISRELYRDYSREAQIVKLLLLGAGESGKSTIVKQMKLLHAVNDRATTGFSDEEKLEAQRAIYANIMDSIVALIEAMENFGLKLKNNKLEEDKFKVGGFTSHRCSLLCASLLTWHTMNALWPMVVGTMFVGPGAIY